MTESGVKLKKVSIFDTSIATKNIGDEIIVDSVYRELRKIFNSNTIFFRLPTHERISRHSHRIISSCQYSFVAGTNILTSHHNILRSNLWNINMIDATKIENAILLGVGWGDYQGTPNRVSKFIYDKILNKNYMHSVRDSYTLNMLKSIGITNVINTGCPTLWELTPEHCDKIPTNKSKDVVCTVTDYKRDEKNDRSMINSLIKEYDNVYCWIQGANDFEYVNNISSSLKIVGPTLSEYDKLLNENGSLDYVGTRLHAGIRALQKNKRTIIIGIDNRAIEMKNDFSLRVLNRNLIEKLSEEIYSNVKCKININYDEINKWKNQFI